MNVWRNGFTSFYKWKNQETEKGNKLAEVSSSLAAELVVTPIS